MPLTTPASVVTVSSVNEAFQGAVSLVDGDPATYWHVAMPPSGEPAWAAIDLGEEAEVQGVRILPRRDEPDQTWNGGTAVLQISASGADAAWQGVATLVWDRGSPADDQAVDYRLPRSVRARFLRLWITDPNFKSLAELTVFRLSLGSERAP